MNINTRIEELKKDGLKFEGLDNCPGCLSEISYCFEHQQVQKTLKEEGYNKLDINCALCPDD